METGFSKDPGLTKFPLFVLNAPLPRSVSLDRSVLKQSSLNVCLCPKLHEAVNREL